MSLFDFFSILVRESLAKCLNCGFGGKSRKAKNWQKWQLCYQCARELHPEEYENEKRHGTGYRYPKETAYADMMEVPIVSMLVAKTSKIHK